MAEGKEHSLCIGLTKLSTQDMYDFFDLTPPPPFCHVTLCFPPMYPEMCTQHRATVNKGIAIESIHFLRDGLWVMKEAHT